MFILPEQPEQSSTSSVQPGESHNPFEDESDEEDDDEKTGQEVPVAVGSSGKEKRERFQRRGGQDQKEEEEEEKTVQDNPLFAAIEESLETGMLPDFVALRQRGTQSVSSSSSSAAAAAAMPDPASYIAALKKVTQDATAQASARLQSIEKRFNEKLAKKTPPTNYQTVLRKALSQQDTDNYVQAATGRGIAFAIGQGGGTKGGGFFGGNLYQEDGLSFASTKGVVIRCDEDVYKLAECFKATYQAMAKATSQNAGGACAATAVVVPHADGRVYIFTNNVGDSPIWLRQKNGSVVSLTKIHQPDMPDERKRLADLKINVDTDCYNPMNKKYQLSGATGILSVSRSFGDAGFKPQATNPTSSGSTDEGELGLHIIPKDEVQGSELLLMTDGVSDVLNEVTLAIIMASAEFKAALNKADFIRAVAETISQHERTPDNTTIEIFNLGKIFAGLRQTVESKGFVAHVYDGHEDGGKLRTTLTQVFNQEFPDQLMRANILTQASQFEPFWGGGVLPDCFSGASFLGNFSQFCNELAPDKELRGDKKDRKKDDKSRERKREKKEKKATDLERQTTQEAAKEKQKQQEQKAKEEKQQQEKLLKERRDQQEKEKKEKRKQEKHKKKFSSVLEHDPLFSEKKPNNLHQQHLQPSYYPQEPSSNEQHIVTEILAQGSVISMGARIQLVMIFLGFVALFLTSYFAGKPIRNFVNDKTDNENLANSASASVAFLAAIVVMFALPVAKSAISGISKCCCSQYGFFSGRLSDDDGIGSAEKGELKKDPKETDSLLPHSGGLGSDQR